MKFNLNLDNIKYLKISYKDKNNYTHSIKTAVKQMGEREIMACTKSEVPLDIVTPQEISLSIICENGLYLTTTELKYINFKESYITFSIKNPEGLEYQQNREYFRVRMDYDVTMHYLDQEIKTNMYNISANGISIKLKNNLAIPNIVDFSIYFPDTEVINTKAEYIRTDNEDNILKASFYFKNLDEKYRNLISKKCIQKQLEEKRNSLV